MAWHFSVYAKRKDMSEINNLEQTEAINKIHEFVRDNATCLFCTAIRTDTPFMTRPMTAQMADDDGNIWFLSNKNSDSNFEIREDDAVQLLFDGGGHTSFLSLFGHAELVKDKAMIEQLWQPIDKAWFKEGQSDPNISVIKVVPHEGYYWDTKHGKVVSFLKILASMAGAAKADDGVQGMVRL
jgi:general stress protein 26